MAGRPIDETTETVEVEIHLRGTPHIVLPGHPPIPLKVTKSNGRTVVRATLPAGGKVKRRLTADPRQV